MADAPPSTSATGRKRLNIRLTLRHYGAADIVRGNIELAALRPVAALNIYTEVLAKTSTGHPVAFLNRSLCYLLLGYPSLAVYDAHRAFLGGLWALKDHVDFRTLTRQIVSYGYHVEKALATDKTSLTALCRFVGGDAVSWLKTDLAALVLEPLPVGIKANEAEWHFTNDIIMKAYWRLAYSLWKCGGGAMRTALEVLADARSRSYRLWEEQRPSSGSRNKIALKPGQLFFDAPLDGYPPLDGYFWAFTELENRMMTEIDQIGSQTGTKGLLSTRYTKIRRELYPWDQISLTAENIDRNFQVLNAHFRDVLSSCEIKPFLEDGKAVKARLYATEGSDTPAGTCLCIERSNLHVTSGDGMTGHTLCHSCAAVLTGPVASIKASNETHRDGLQPCKYCEDAVYCSSACREYGDRTHLHSCNMELERYLSTYSVENSWSGVPEPHMRRLLKLMMLRVITTQRSKQEHPLNIPWVKVLDGNLSSARKLPDDRGDQTRGFLTEPCTPEIATLFPEVSAVHGRCLGNILGYFPLFRRALPSLDEPTTSLLHQCGGPQA